MTRAITVSAGPRFTWESTKAVAPYFGIDAVQAMASGLSVFDAKGGAHSAGAGAQVQYRINPQWEVHSYVEYERLLGDAANSPLVTARGSVNQTTVGIGACGVDDCAMTVLATVVSTATRCRRRNLLNR